MFSSTCWKPAGWLSLAESGLDVLGLFLRLFGCGCAEGWPDITRGWWGRTGGLFGCGDLVWACLGRNLDNFDLALLSLQKLNVAMVFALELKLSKTLRGLVYFVLQLWGGLRPPYKYGTKYTSPLRVFDNFNSKAKTKATFDFSNIKNAKSKVT